MYFSLFYVILLLNNLEPGLRRERSDYSSGTTPGRTIQNDYESCNIGVRIDTSLPLPLLFVRFPGVGQGCWGATDWSGLVDPSRLVSTHNPLHPDFPLPLSPHSIHRFSHNRFARERGDLVET